MKPRIRRSTLTHTLAAVFLLSAVAARAQTVGLTREIYQGIPGNELAALTSSPLFPDSPSARSVLTVAFESGPNLGENYGARIRGFLRPPETGDYVFWIASDDESALFLGTSENPASRREIASLGGATGFRDWFADPGQQSARIRLESSRLYYIEALMKEGGGGDHVSVRWQRPSGTIEEPIPAEHFSPVGTPLFAPRLTRQPGSLTVTEGKPAVFRAEVSNTDPVRYQWQRGGVPIPGATSSTLTIPRTTLSDDGARIRITLTNPLGFALSEEALLTVLPDREAPTVTSVYSASPTNVVVKFSEPVSTNSAWLVRNYAIDGGVVVRAAGPGGDAASVVLGVSPLADAATHVLTVSGVTDLAAAANPVAPGTSVPFTVLGLAPVDVGGTVVPATVMPAPGGFDVTATGVGAGGTNDQFHFSQRVRTGDFDVVVRVESMSAESAFAQAGLMVRQSLATDSPYAATVATPGIAGSSFTWRGQTGTVATAEGYWPANPPHTWLRLRRQGTNVTGYASDDGAAWARLGTAGIGFSNTVHLGVFASSRGTNATRPLVVAFRDFGEHKDRESQGYLPDDLEPPGPSSRRTALVISEIMHRPSSREDNRRLEFVEVFNSDSVFADLGGFRLDGDISYTFPEGTRLPAGGYLVVAQTPIDLAASSDVNGAPVLGPWTGGLPSESGTVRLLNRTGALLLEVTYEEGAPWPAAAEGGGHSLVLARPSFGENDARAWAASERRGGSPGRAEVRLPDPLRRVRINEVLANTDAPMLDFVELRNLGSTEVNLGGIALSDDPDRVRFRIPEGTILAPGGHRAWTEAELGFALSAAGETVWLTSADGGRVIDAVRFGPQLLGVSSGRAADGTGEWALLETPTPSEPNDERRREAIVISEIMYRPPIGAPGEYVELHNRGTAPVDLRGWRFVDGIDFTFASSTIVTPGSYLAVAADPAYLRSVHPGLDPGRIVGGFGGNLSNAGERVALARPEPMVVINPQGVPVPTTALVTVAEVHYRDGGRWGRWSDGGGSSLELRDLRATTGAAAWGDSDESTKADWVTVDVTGRLELGSGGATELHVMLLGMGECLVDDVVLLDAGGASRIANGGFEGGIDGWMAQGNHVASRLGETGFQSRRSLHVRASSGGDNGANRIKIVLAGGGLADESQVTLRAKVRWLRGHPDLLFRLKGNYFEHTVSMPAPHALGTPGAANTLRTANAGPSIGGVAHHPVLPAALEPVRVTAWAADPDGVAELRLKYRFDPSVTVRDLVMRDDGSDGDEVAGDGIHTATIPGQAAGVLAAFRVEARDAATPAAVASFPEAPDLGECLVRFGDPIPSGSFGTYRLWMTQARTDLWGAREVMSNEALDGTVVYGAHRAIYNAGARYRGSPFIRPNYDTPTGALSAYVWTLPSDDPLLGTDEFNLDWLEQPGRDATLQRERMSFWIGDRLGVPFSHQRYVRIVVNGVLRGEVYADSQQPNRDYVMSWFPEADDGEIFKIDDWFEFNDSVAREFNVDAVLGEFVGGDGRLSRTRYRWNWEKKANGGLDDDYSSLLNLVEVMNLPDPEAYTSRVPEVVDLDGWLRAIATRRVVADWDGYGYNRGKNTFAYLPPGGRWHLLLWDLDFSLGGGSDGPNTGLFHADDPVMERMYRNPLFGRVYLQAFADAIRGPLAPGAADALMEANHAAFVGNDVAAASPAPIQAWLAARRTYLARVLATNTAPWSVQTGNETPLVTDQTVIRVSGTAPIEVRSISVNGFAYAPQWSSITNWTLSIPLRAGTNQLQLAALDRLGNPLVAAQTTVRVVSTAVEERPEDHVAMVEIDYEPADPDAEFVEIHNGSTRTTFDLSGWRLDGVDLVLPGGVALAPGERVVVVKNRAAFLEAHGQGPRVIAEFPGRLNNAGETLRLSRPGSPTQPWEIVDEVTYSNRAPWPERAAGGGGSLQALDASEDNRRPSNWGAVDASGSGQATWRFVSLTDRLASRELVFSLDGVGVVHVDDVSLVAGSVPRVGTEWVANGGFESALTGTWAVGATGTSALESGVRRSGRSSLRLAVPAGVGAADAAVRQTLRAEAAVGQMHTLSFWYLANPAGAGIVVRSEGGGLFGTFDAVETPVASSTPGAANSLAAAVPPFPDVWINEVQARGLGGVGAGWIELYNAGETPVNLTGWFLSPDPAFPGAWAFPAGAVLGAREFRVVKADGQSGIDAEGWHAGFVLSPARGSVVLSRTAGGVPAAVDYLHYDALADGRSVGSHPDGAWSERLGFEVPTPAAPNDRSSLPVRVVFNEWMSRNNTTITDPAGGDFDDWFELYNAGDTALDLAGYSLTDDTTNPRRTVIPTGFVLPPRGVMLVWADGETGQNGPGRELHVGFALSADGETLALYSPGGVLVDLVRFGALGRDVSHGLMPDGAVGTAMRLPAPTPGARNAGSPGDELRLTGFDIAEGLVTLSWASVPGGRYELEVTTGLDQGWLRVGDAILATGPETRITHLAGDEPVRFYRVVQR